jgi:phosphate transport system substrate-binding protein
MTLNSEFSSRPALRLDEVDPALPPYEPLESVTGTLTAWGDPAFQALWAGWTEAFTEFHPKMTYDHFLVGTSTAVGALYTKTADIGLFGREIRRLEKTSWKRVFTHQPVGFAIATGSFDVFAKTVAVALLINAANPLRHLTFRQLDAIYSKDLRRSGPEPIRTWGQLDLTGTWADAPIKIYGLDPDTGTAQHVRLRVLLDGRWADDVSLPKGAPAEMYAGSGGHAADALVTALETDRYAIGIAGFRNLTPKLKAVAVAENDGDEPVEGSWDSTRSRRYPLSRSVYAFVREQVDTPWDPKLREFTRFLLSREGQAVVAAEGDYHPLPARIVNTELQRVRPR